MNLGKICICMISVLHHTTPHHTTPHHTTPHHTTPHHTTPHHTTPHHTTPHHTTPPHPTPPSMYVMWCRLTRLSEGQQGRVLLHPSCQGCWRQRGPQKAGPIPWMIARTQAALQVQVNNSRRGIGPRYGMPSLGLVFRSELPNKQYISAAQQLLAVLYALTCQISSNV